MLEILLKGIAREFNCCFLVAKSEKKTKQNIEKKKKKTKTKTPPPKTHTQILGVFCT